MLSEKVAALEKVSELEDENRQLAKKLKQTNPQGESHDSKTKTLDPNRVIAALVKNQTIAIAPMTFDVRFGSIWCTGVSVLLGGPPLEFYSPDAEGMFFPITGAVECTGFTVNCSSDGDADRFREAVKQALSRVVSSESVMDEIVTQEKESVTVDISVLELNTESPLAIGLVRVQKSRIGGGSKFGFTVYHNHRNDYSNSKAKINSSFIGYATCATCGGSAVHQCSRCKGTRYCSKGCQETHWRSGHKHNCKNKLKVNDIASL